MSLPELRLQLAAVALSEELNFTRAAERLRITQPALSKQIGELEKQIGFSIFRRVPRGVELTEAGQVFIRGCKDSLGLLEKSIRLAKSSHDQIDPLIAVGHSPYADPVLISSLLAVHLPLYPTMRLRMESMFAAELGHSIIAAELDIALITDPPGNPLLTQVKLATAPMCVVMSTDHPAGKKSTVAIEDFPGIGWMIFSRKTHPAIYDRFIEASQSSGVSPIELHHYLSPQEVPQLIHENFGIAIMPQGVAEQLRGPEICVRPLSHLSLQLTSYLVLRADQSSRLVNEFGRAFLKRVIPNAQYVEASGQLRLRL